ncbi:ABC transporter ATP-binding protein [Nitriliruptoraceae bacterium ZYF776]|nr:ABC transporter ATP-binding protein [Profundirhabdus halotolerans]
MTTALELAEVRKAYPSGDQEIVALDRVDLRVDAGEVLMLLGPSGSGKTTLLSIAGGLLTPTEGTVRVGGDDIAQLSERDLARFRQQRIGFVFQAVNLVPFLTARENLLVVRSFNGGKVDAAARARADELLGELGLGDRAGNLPSELSGGQRQRVAIGRALMNEPDLVLVDEPTASLDTELGEQVMQLLRDEVTGRGVAAVIVTHDERMTGYADRLQRILDGRLTDAA